MRSHVPRLSEPYYDRVVFPVLFSKYTSMHSPDHMLACRKGKAAFLPTSQILSIHNVSSLHLALYTAPAHSHGGSNSNASDDAQTPYCCAFKTVQISKRGSLHSASCHINISMTSPDMLSSFQSHSQTEPASRDTFLTSCYSSLPSKFATARFLQHLDLAVIHYQYHCHAREAARCHGVTRSSSLDTHAPLSNHKISQSPLSAPALVASCNHFNT